VIPFNKPYIVGNEAAYIAEAIASRKLSGDRDFTKRAQHLLECQLGSGKALLTTSCTDALEAAALLCELRPGDEIIMPSYTFVSTANAFALRGATIRFADSEANNPNIAVDSVAELVNERTRAIVPVHYAGVACDMDRLREQADRVGALIIEDAAQAIASYYKGRPLGTLGDLAAFSFHETKNIIAGEGGSLHINDPQRIMGAEIVREKGTNRSAFFRGDVDKYTWVGLGSSYLPSELIAAFLTAQLEAIEEIQGKRIAIWEHYRERLGGLIGRDDCSLPVIPEYASNNAHMFYLVCNTLETRSALIDYLKANSILAVFHYQALHASRYFADLNGVSHLPNASRYTDCLVRLPLFPELSTDMVDQVADAVNRFFANRTKELGG
jgi:dTDP-4-amino-4,6-dideoxygalactose transaminase